MRERMKSAARSAEQSSVLRGMARGGYLANGAVHAIIGGLALAIAFTGKGDSDQSSALTAIASAPLGVFVLGAIAILLLALGCFHAFTGVAQRSGKRRQKWGRRISEFGQAIAFLVSGAVAASIVLGNRSDSDQSAEKASRGLLDQPGGPVLLTIAGAALAIGGLVFVGMGLLRSFRKKLRLPDGPLGTAVTALGVVGFAGKGATIAVVGVLVVMAAVRDDPDSAGALDTAIQTLRTLPGGAVIVGAIGVGFIAYGCFCGFRARYARL